MRYKDLGYRSYLVGFQTPVMGHAICLIEYKNRLIVMDPTFNSSFVNSSDGEPLSIFDVMEAAYFPDRVPMALVLGQPVSVNFIQMKTDPISQTHAYRSDHILSRGDKYDLYAATISISRFEKSISKKLKEYSTTERLPPTATTAIYTGEPIYVYNTYPMSEDEKSDADELHEKLLHHYKRLLKERSLLSYAFE
jgi:hypothetical protein